MLQLSGQAQQRPIRRHAFSNQIWNALHRSERGRLRLRAGSHNELRVRMAAIATEMEVADWPDIVSILDINPHVMQIAELEHEPGISGLVALLPLNAGGMAALIEGRFSGLAPQTGWIARPGECPESIYVWLIHMPGHFARLLSAFGAALERYLQLPVPIFSKAVNAHSARLQAGAGFLEARHYYPGCDPALLVVFPHTAQAHIPLTEISVARSVEDIFKVLSVRSATYVAEQYCSYNEEFDGNDFCATHFLGTIDGDAAGCVRLRFFAGFAKLERLAVREEYRQSRLAFALVREAISHCARKGYSHIIGHSRSDLVRFWRTFGFRPVPGRAPFSFAKIDYVEIECALDPHADPITADVAPLRILRPEGAWDQPGVYERPQINSKLEGRRAALIEARVKRISQTG
jgi:predicted GNAT family N-acyltransferase